MAVAEVYAAAEKVKLVRDAKQMTMKARPGFSLS
jgi:hypothetical protein